MSDLNNINFRGNLVAAIKIHNDKAYFTVASNRSYPSDKEESGYAKVTTYVPVRMNMNASLAATLGKRLKQGVKVTVTGSLNTYVGRQEVFVKREDELKGIPDNQFIVNASDVQIDYVKGSGSAASAASQEGEDQPPFDV